MKNWRSTVFGIVGAAFGAFATIENLNTLTPKQASMAFVGCLLFAIQGAISADAKNVKELAATICHHCGKPLS